MIGVESFGQFTDLPSVQRTRFFTFSIGVSQTTLSVVPCVFPLRSCC